MSVILKLPRASVNRAPAIFAAAKIRTSRRESSAAEANPVSVIIPADRMGESTEALRRINNGETLPPFETVRVRREGTRIDISLSV